MASSKLFILLIFFSLLVIFLFIISPNQVHEALQPMQKLGSLLPRYNLQWQPPQPSSPPEGANRTILAGNFHFGNIAVFDDPITVDNNLRSKPLGMAQGFYIYDTKNTYTAWLGFSFVLNCTDHQGPINFAGEDPLVVKSRDISVVGGTGNFFMHHGVATIMTDAFEGKVYFRLRVDNKFYKSW